MPWLLVTVLVLPVLDYMHYKAQSSMYETPSMSFGTFWVLSMRKIAEFHFGWMEMTDYRNMTEHFYQRYVWFLSLLLLYFAMFAVVYGIWRWRKPAHPRTGASTMTNLRLFLYTGILTSLLFATVRVADLPRPFEFGLVFIREHRSIPARKSNDVCRLLCAWGGCLHFESI